MVAFVYRRLKRFREPAYERDNNKNIKKATNYKGVKIK